jgi:transposase
MTDATAGQVEGGDAYEEVDEGLGDDGRVRCCGHGVQFVVAVTTIAELGDLSRFDSPRQLMSYLGLIPSVDFSGPRRRLGSITKAGNAHARRMLVEAAWAYQYPAKITPHI